MTHTLTPPERIAYLRAEIERHNDLYFNQDNPEITDEQYDALLLELQALEAQYPELRSDDSPSQQVGGRATGNFRTVTHPTPMMSLDKAFTTDDLTDFDTRLKRHLGRSLDEALTYTCEVKVDGLSVNLFYRDGALQWAATRGNGETGDDVTQNVLTIPGLPTALPGLKGELEVRGEVYLTTEAFHAYNARALQDGRPTLKNPRNGAAGGLKQKDPEETRKRGLQAVFYALGKRDGVQARTQADVHAWLRDHGFPVSPYVEVAQGIEAAGAYHARMHARRADLPFEIDGTVMKLNDLGLQDAAGFTSSAPRWAVAFKFVAEEAHTVLEAITVNTGRTGRLAPLAHLRPVLLAGSTVSKASLHNADFIREKDVRVGDTVVIIKSGDVIPYLKRVVVEARPESTVPYAFPSHCPSCGHAVERVEDDADAYCPNPQCPAQQFERLKYFAARDTMDLRGLGPAVISALLRDGLVRDAADLYALTAEQLAELNLAEDAGKVRKFGRKNADKLVGELEASKSVELWRFIRALSIPEVGGGGAELLAKAFPTLDDFLVATFDQLNAIKGIGPVTARYVVASLADDSTQDFIRRLRLAGVNPVNPDTKRGDQLAGLTFVITGALSKPRGAFESHLEAHGAKISGSVSKKTSYVVAGAEAGSKLEKANTLGVPVLDEAALADLLGRFGVPAVG